MTTWEQIDRVRLQYCRQTSPEMSNAELARYYNFNIGFVEAHLGADRSTLVKRNKRPDWLALARAFADSNPGTQVNAATLVEVIGFSLPTAYKTIDALPNSYRKVKRGLWECRNEQEDRRNAKQ